jgi:hypothetical protein
MGGDPTAIKKGKYLSKGLGKKLNKEVQNAH